MKFQVFTLKKGDFFYFLKKWIFTISVTDGLFAILKIRFT